MGAIKTYVSRSFRYVVEAYSTIVQGVSDLIIIYLIHFAVRLRSQG
ncbi:hypothetical protein ACFO1V_13045 [Daeguia caeni]|uniref:Uncharacterized protein n=1 Tax=Daeguia caeni TaxID=439612 RepID=A0ABV9H9Y3_9HYPH